MQVIGRSGATFTRVWSGTGIGGADLTDARDRIVAYDEERAGSPLQLVAYRPGVGTAAVAGRPRPGPA